MKYRIEAESPEAVIAKVAAADPDFIVYGEGGVARMKQSRGTDPAPVTEPGTPVSDGEGGTYAPQVPVSPARWFTIIEADENPALAAITLRI